MTLLLSLETSTHSCSCALHQDGKLVAQKISLEEQTTAAMLAVMIDELFNESGFGKNQLSAVIVASGPGSYTGLRIGIATAKGICYALNIHLIAVNTLSLLVKEFIEQYSGSYNLKEALFCPMLDARRMEVYCMLTNMDGKIIEPVQAKVIDEQSFNGVLNSSEIYFFGEGSDKCKNSIHHVNAKFIAAIKPTASILGAMGFQKFLNNEFENPDLFQPLYLKDFLIKKPNFVS